MFEWNVKHCIHVLHKSRISYIHSCDSCVDSDVKTILHIVESDVSSHCVFPDAFVSHGSKFDIPSRGPLLWLGEPRRQESCNQ